MSLTTRINRPGLAFFALLLVYVVAIVAPAEYGTINPSIPFPTYPYACSDSLDLNSQVCGFNLGLIIGWPVIATMLLSGLMAFLFRNDNQFGGI